MINLYWVAFGFGGVFLVLTTFMGADHDHDGSMDHDISGHDLDTDTADLDHIHVDHGDVSHPGILDILFLVFSIRFWSFFIAFFGLTGVGMTYIHGPGIVTFLIALGMGLTAGFSISYLFRVMSRGNVSSEVSSSDMLGRTGKIIVPLSPGDNGKIRLVIKGQILDRIAISDDAEFEIGDEATVVKVEDNKVKVISTSKNISEK
ncbi:MAG: NfeD family protein [Deltaproteobacteria bacterium]|nr:NfeD family protein [Deltaproteobacteria bacterium]